MDDELERWLKHQRRMAVFNVALALVAFAFATAGIMGWLP